MIADFDTQGAVLGIVLDGRLAQWGIDTLHPRLVVHTRDGAVQAVDVLDPEAGVDEPLGVVADRFGVDLVALTAAARAALAAPDREVRVEVAGPG